MGKITDSTGDNLSWRRLQAGLPSRGVRTTAVDEIGREEYWGLLTKTRTPGKPKFEEEAKKDAPVKERTEHITKELKPSWREKTYAFEVLSYLAIYEIMNYLFRC